MNRTLRSGLLALAVLVSIFATACTNGGGGSAAPAASGGAPAVSQPAPSAPAVGY